MSPEHAQQFLERYRQDVDFRNQVIGARSLSERIAIVQAHGYEIGWGASRASQTLARPRPDSR